MSGQIKITDLKVALRAFGTEPVKNELKTLTGMLETE